MSVIEQWRPCPGFVDYEISSEGRLRRIRSRRKISLLRPLALQVRGKGYLSYVFKMGGRRTTKEIHPLVCEAFHGPKPSPFHEAAHWDGDKKNNRAGNLRWATRKGNMGDMIRHRRTTRGERNACAKLNEQQVIEIRTLYQAMKVGRYCRPSPARVLGERFNISPAHVKRVATGERWGHITEPKA